MGATNCAELLDPELMRPGRFDRKVRMPKPDTEGRFDVLQLHLRKKKIAPDVDLMQLSRDLPGLVGADLADIVNEAQLTAVRAGRTEITARDMYAGVDRFTQGELRPPIPTTNKLPISVFAAKEAGIALVADLLYMKHTRIEELERDLMKIPADDPRGA
ncbi:putative cell division protease ftsH, chloroplastic, partial [Haematococcus lacustris]